MAIERIVSGSSLKKELVQKIFKLFSAQTWLVKREGEFVELLELCDEPDHVELVFELLHEFNFFDSEQVALTIKGMADYIVNHLGWEKDEVQVVAMTYDGKDPDSGQQILQMLKPHLAVLDWDDVRMCNLFGRVFKKLLETPKVILVDEFAGTGNTIIKRINALVGQADPEVQLEIAVVLFAAMRPAVEFLESQGVNVFAFHTFEPGISSLGDHALVENKIRNMRRIESKFLATVNEHELPSLGYGEAEALYSMENGNTPNSVFPIFWWRYLADEQRFYPVLDRGDRKYVMAT